MTPLRNEEILVVLVVKKRPHFCAKKKKVWLTLKAIRISTGKLTLPIQQKSKRWTNNRHKTFPLLQCPKSNVLNTTRTGILVKKKAAIFRKLYACELYEM